MSLPKGLVVSEPRTWERFEATEIGDGSLDGELPVEVFTAGVQWAVSYCAAQRKDPVSVLAYPWNTDRILAMLRRNGYYTQCRVAGDFIEINAKRPNWNNK